MTAIKTKKIILTIGIIFLIVWSIFLITVDVAAFIESIKLGNAYLVLFLIAVFSSSSFLTSASFYATFVAYANSGLDIYAISIIGGIGMGISDSIFFYLSRTAGDVISKDSKLYNKVYNYVSKLPRWGVYIFTFCYSAFAPLPNDILIVTLGVLKFKYSRIIPLLILGNVVLLFLIASGIHHIS